MRNSQKVQWDARQLVTVLAGLLTCSRTLTPAVGADQVDSLRIVGLGGRGMV